jgi:Zn finger protein HypA/HybF involved in hydrogenase expression
MSISMDKFTSDGHFATYDSQPKIAIRQEVFVLQCHCCGFEPLDPVDAPRVCPKCHSTAWERYAKPGSILENACRYVA